MDILNSSVGKQYKKEEKFEWKKFIKGVFSFSSVEFAKDIYGLFNIRKLTFYLLIIGVIFAYGYWKGQSGKPISVNLNYEEAVEIQVPNSDLRLYKPDNSSELFWIDKEGNKINVKVKDIPSLRKALKPYGIVFEPYAIGGIGIGEKKNGFEGGIGANFLKYYQWRLNSSLTSMGIYLGVGYKLVGLKMDNTSVILSYGKGWSGDNRVMFGIAIEF